MVAFYVENKTPNATGMRCVQFTRPLGAASLCIPKESDAIAHGTRKCRVDVRVPHSPSDGSARTWNRSDTNGKVTRSEDVPVSTSNILFGAHVVPIGRFHGLLMRGTVT